MTLEEAIKYAENMAILSHRGSGNDECEQNHKQLAEWLRELKNYRARIPSYETGYNDAKREIALSGEYERAYERGKSDVEQTKWISVSKRLPEENGRYIVTRGLNACGSLWNRVYIVNYSDLMGLKSERIWWDGNVGKSDFERIDDVIAWMPLLEPYKAERRRNDTD